MTCLGNKPIRKKLDIQTETYSNLLFNNYHAIEQGSAIHRLTHSEDNISFRQLYTFVMT